MKRIRNIILLTIGLILILFIANKILMYQQPSVKKIPHYRSGYIISGFQINNVTDARDAASDGIQQAFIYGDPFPENSEMGHAFKALHMKQVGAKIWYYLYLYECHRLFQRHLDPDRYCSQDYSNMDYQTLMNDIKNTILNEKSNSELLGYWILDDWPATDEGSGKSVLQEITRMVHAFDPGKPTICGFGAELGINHTDIFAPGVVKNFSPEGCDMVGIYVYSQSVKDAETSPSTFDWSMSTLLPNILGALQEQGWINNEEPFMGIAQAWAGKRTDVEGLYEIVPTAEDIEQQSLSFCEHGSQGINYYAWYDSTVSGIQTPANNPQIKEGVIRGIKTCKQYWGITPSS